MVLVNTTFAVAPQADSSLRHWIRNTFFPTALAEGGFSAPLFSRVLSADADCAASYAAQMQSPSLEAARQWHENGAGATLLRALRHEHGDNILWFTTYMEVIE